MTAPLDDAALDDLLIWLRQDATNAPWIDALAALRSRIRELESAPASEHIAGLIDALGYQQQCDESGELCAVSRQAVDEARQELHRLDRERQQWERTATNSAEEARINYARAEREWAEHDALRKDAERWFNLLRGYRKIVNDLSPYFDKPITDETVVLWLNLNNAGATIDAAIAASAKEKR